MTWARLAQEMGWNVPKGRAIQALLWAELAVLPAEAERTRLLAPPTLDTVTVNIHSPAHPGASASHIARGRA